jgi:PAP2 superfamily protein
MSTLTEHRQDLVPASAPSSRRPGESAAPRWPASGSLPQLRLPAGLREVVLLAFLWLGYSATRLVASNDLSSARRRAGDLLDVERLLHLDIEAWLNHAVAPVTQLAVPMALWYASLHYVVTPAVLAFLFFRRRADYGRARNALAIGTTVGLLAYLLIPTAPPRLMAGGSYLDVLARTAQYGWWSTHASAPAGLGDVSNELAAMPSLHVGWAVWVAWAIWRHVGLVGRSVATLYVIGTTIVVLATGNHWLLDAVAGAAVVTLGIVLSNRIRAVRRPRPEAPS